MPHTTAANEQSATTIETIIRTHPSGRDALLPMLRAIHDQLGDIPGDSVPLIAHALNVSRAEVYGAITYYRHFRKRPVGSHVIQVCRGETCRARGGDALAAHVREALGCEFHGTTADGNLTLESVYCLGHCVVGPNIAIDGKPYANVCSGRFDVLLQRVGSMR
jgi:formate dehydrogenase subunit gamma